MTRARLRFVNLVLLAWLLAVQVAYYRVHKPIEPGAAAGFALTRDLLARPWEITALLQPLGDLLIVGGLLALAWLLGRALLRVALLAPQSVSVLEAGLLATALGLGGLSLLTLGLLALGWFTLPVVFALAGTGAAVLIVIEGRATPGIVQRFLSPHPHPLPEGEGTVGAGLKSAPTALFPHTVIAREDQGKGGDHTDRGLGPLVSWLLSTYIVLALTLALLRALAPPIGWDSLVYHLTGPRLWVAAGRMVGGIDLPHYYFPPLVELLYALPLLLRGDTAAQALHTALAALTVAATELTARRFLGPVYGLPAAALLLSGISLVNLAGRAYVEWGLMLFVVLAAWSLARWRMEGSDRGLALAGVFLGLGLGVKYTAVAMVAGAVLFVVGTEVAARRPKGRASVGTIAGPGLQAGEPGVSELGWKRPVSRRETGILSRTARLGLTTGIVATPWYLRTLALTGNLVYPFVFGGWNWDGWKAEWFSRAGTGLIQEPWRILLAPWELTVLGVEGGAVYDGAIGPLFLILLPLLIFLPRPALVQACLTVAGVAYAFWLAGATSSALLQQPRLLYPVFPLLSILGAWALLGTRAWALPFFRPRRLLVATVVLSLGLALVSLTTQFVADTPLAYLVGAESRDEYLTRHLDGYATVVGSLDRRAGPEARVLFLWEPRTYLCPVACQPDGLLFNWRYALHRYQSVAEIHEAWVAAGYTHVLLHGAGMRYFLELANGEVDPSHVAALQDMEARYLERLEGPDVREAAAGEEERYSLYRIRWEP